MLVILLLYVVATLPFMILFAQAEAFRFATVHELSRKMAHVRRLEFLLLGDSITAGGGYWGTRLGKSPFDAVNLAVPGYTIRQVRDGQALNGARLHPRVVLIMAGTNDFRTGRSVDDILTDFEALLDAVSACGAEKVVVTSVSVLAKQDDDDGIIALNRRLRALVESHGAKFLDLNESIRQHPTRTSLYEPDGLHFSEAMYGIWSSALRALVN